MVNTLTPVFKWRGSDGDNIEYRLIIADQNGKTILDQWVDSDTSLVISNPNLFADLKIYLWNVLAYRGSQSVQSKTGSFYIDLNISLDLELTHVRLLSRKSSWKAGDLVNFEIEVLNCGPVPCFNSRVTLFNGNANRNYRDKYALRKSRAMDNTVISQLEPGKTARVQLQGRVLGGFNHFYARVQTENKNVDFFLANNTKEGPTIQTITDNWQLDGLFVIFSHYQEPSSGIHKISAEELATIDENISKTQEFFWKHTRLLRINADTLIINKILTDSDFTFIDENWGYVLAPWDVEYELKLHGITNNEYDFIFVYYPWRNSIYSWSGYRGYTYGTVKTILGKTAFAAQPVLVKESEPELITIHEILHIIDHFFESSGIKDFYSPDNKTRHTTFTNDCDYYEWMLETFPAKYWFKLKWGEPIVNITTNRITFSGLPRDLKLYQNYPNPFNSSTIITYELPPGANSHPIHVRLSIYSVLGEQVCILEDDYKKAGTYSVSWNGTNKYGESVSSGIYLYRIEAGKQAKMRKLLLIK